jgi:hypothetical protein
MAGLMCAYRLACRHINTGPTAWGDGVWPQAPPQAPLSGGERRRGRGRRRRREPRRVVLAGARRSTGREPRPTRRRVGLGSLLLVASRLREYRHSHSPGLLAGGARAAPGWPSTAPQTATPRCV